MEQENEDYKSTSSYKSGEWIANPPEGNEVVITGLSGVFPNSKNVHHFRDNLYNKVDMVSDDERRWEKSHPEVPQRTGKIYDVEKFDAGYFGVHCKQAHTMDPMSRLFLERAIEAIYDAGINPADLEGTKTGVFVGVCFSESEKNWFFDRISSKSYAITGCMRCMIANRLSYHLKLKGPSYTDDTACSSSLYALENAFRAIRSGQCEMAIVGGANLCLHPFVSLQFARLGVLSFDGACKVFDENGNGYARSESIAAVLLQKSKDARRVYAQIIHGKTNCDGYKEQGITFPSGEAQRILMQEFYQECGINPKTLSFLEAHGTGTKVGDPEEIIAIDEIFCQDRKTPLLIGSVKSSIGHSEPASGLCSITKVVIGMENDLIPPNINYKTPRAGVEALEKGRLQVVTEKMPFQDNRGLIGVNSFGFGGGNCHILLQWNKKEKIDNGQPKDSLPRLVCISGRLKESIDSILDDIKNRKLDAEYIKLYHEIFRKNIVSHCYRGYSIVSKFGEISRSYKIFDNARKPIYLIFGDFPNWSFIAKDLFGLPIFAGAIQKMHEVLNPIGINITEILVNDNNLGNKSVIDNIFGTIAVQIGLVDVLKKLNIEPNGIFGFGLGEFICSYFEGSLKLEQILPCFHQIALVMKENQINSYSELNGKFKSQLLNKLNGIINRAKQKSSKWLSFSKDKNFFLSNENGDQNIFKYIQKNTIILEFGEGRSLDTKHHNKYLYFKECQRNNNLVTLLENFGRLYEFGFNPQIDKLYPEVEYPVSRGTPMISPIIKWNHQKDWSVTTYKTENLLSIRERLVMVSLKDRHWRFIAGHVIDGRNLFPATGYLNFAWEAIALVTGKMQSDLKIILGNVKFHRATTVPKEGKIEFSISIQRGTGYFEISERGTVVVTGVIQESPDLSKNQINLPLEKDEPNEEIAMQTKDIYKELRLRGYNYHGEFQKIKNCNLNVTKATIRWDENWITFMDNLLQIKILQLDTRLLYVPTGVKYFTIHTKYHLNYVKQFGDNPNLPVYYYKDLDIIKCGGIEIRGLQAASIAKKKDMNEPILEKYIFVPNEAKLNLDESVRVNMQIAIENSQIIKVKSVELVDDASNGDDLLSPLVYQALGDLPLIQTNITILSKKPIDLPNFTVIDKNLITESDCFLVIGSNLLQKPLVLNQALGVLKENGYILSREAATFNYTTNNSSIKILTIHTIQREKIYLIRKKIDQKVPRTIKISNLDFNWVPILQNAIKYDENVVLYAQNDPTSGILGLTNCLRREPGGRNVKCFFIIDNAAPNFDIQNDFYRNQLKKKLAINVYENSTWGTYRHVLLQEIKEVEREHCYVNITVRGDLSSLKWIEGPLTSKSVLSPEKELIYVYYASLNFRDVMTASGRINADVVTLDRTIQECVQGFEFAGRRSNGERVMGMVTSGALSTLLAADTYLLWPIPNQWKFEEAATIPVVYGTVIYCLFMRTTIKKGQTILIHAGTGGIGQAAIAVALHFGLIVYTTVGTKEKREFLKKRYPQLRDRNIGNSRDTTFEQLIFEQTNGRGVDIVINSLAEEKLQASVRCLAKYGKFFEIGKFDLANNNQLQLMFFKKEASFHGVMLDQLFNEQPNVKRTLADIITRGMVEGFVKPLSRNIFGDNEVEKAFRFMAGGKHMGKVLIKIRKEENEKIIKPPIQFHKAKPRHFCNPNNSYIIVGGLGGFGLELTDWLILRGARKLVLVSRKGVTNGYQSYRFKIWKTYGTYIHVSTSDVTTIKGCKKLIDEATTLGPVESIFNLATVLKDSLLENQSAETFQISFNPKAIATQNLDIVSRQFCSQLKNFVVFSSVSCGRGNIGQTNYGMANSVMEKICEQRKKDNLPGLAIQWGAIGDVGLVAEMQEVNTEIEIGGTLQQKITNCLNVLDALMGQKNTIVSSMIVAEKRGGIGGSDNIVDSVAKILGIRDVKTVSFHSTLPELGMDSMTGVEIKQTLEREFEVFLTAQDIRNITFARLLEIQEEKLFGDKDLTNLRKETEVEGLEMMLRLINDESISKIPVLHLKSKIQKHVQAPKAFFFPGIEGAIGILEPLLQNLNIHGIGMQYLFDHSQLTVKDIANHVIPLVQENMDSNHFNIVAYSYGTIIALEIAAILESKGCKGNIVCLDGSPQMICELTKRQLQLGSNALFETSLLCILMALYMPTDIILKHKEKILQCQTFEDRLNAAEKLAPENTPHSMEYLKKISTGILHRLKALTMYKPQYPKLKSKVKLFKGKQLSILDFSEDYKLSELCENPVEIKVFQGNHVTILENLDLAKAIDNAFLEPLVANDKTAIVIDTVETVSIKQI